MKPPVLYFGAKGNLAEQIVDLMPEHVGYVEPFCGSLAVLLAKPPVKQEVVNDSDHELMNFWHQLRDNPTELIRAAALTPHSRAEMQQAWDRGPELSDLERARRVWITLTQGRGASLRYRSGWRAFFDSVATSASIGTYMDAYRNRLAPAAERIRNVSLECRDALEVIDDYGSAESNLLYVDPPYLYSTRSGKSSPRYADEFASDAQHRELAEHLLACNSAVMLSGYPSPLYDDLFAGWDRHDFTGRSDNALQRDRTEVIWSNRPLGGGLLW